MGIRVVRVGGTLCSEVTRVRGTWDLGGKDRGHLESPGLTLKLV